MIRGSIGPIKAILTGYRMEDTTLLHPVSDLVPKKDSPFSGMSLTTDRKITLKIKRNTNPEIRNRKTNFFLEIFMYFILKSTLFYKVKKKVTLNTKY